MRMTLVVRKQVMSRLNANGKVEVVATSEVVVVVRSMLQALCFVVADCVSQSHVMLTPMGKGIETRSIDEK